MRERTERGGLFERVYIYTMPMPIPVAVAVAWYQVSLVATLLEVHFINYL